MNPGAVVESAQGGSAVHAAPLMRPLGVVGQQVGVERGLHFLDGLEPGARPFDAGMLVEEGPAQALDDAVGLRPFHAGAFVLDVFELEEQLVGMLVLAPAEFAAIVGQHRLDAGAGGVEGGQDVVVQGAGTAVSGSLLL